MSNALNITSQKSSVEVGKRHSKKINYPFTTENGAIIHRPAVSYQTWGTLNKSQDNAVLVCHALTGNTNADEWFRGLFGEGRPLDPNQQFIICPNVLGSCYGTTGPMSINPQTGTCYQADFPEVTVRDAVRLHQQLLDELRINELQFVIGGSLGGMQALEFSIMDNRAQAAIFIGMGKAHRPWQIGISQTQRQAIFNDPNWQNGFYRQKEPPLEGLALARMIAMNSYRSPQDFDRKFSRTRQGESEQYQIASYLNYQGQKLATRFDAVSYVRLTQMMDSHDVAEGRGSYESVLKGVTIPTLVAGINSDWLYPVDEQKDLANLLANGTYAEIVSSHGHDAFLIEFEQMNELFTSFLESTKLKHYR
jgi:homoserine O-acetyltransferase